MTVLISSPQLGFWLAYFIPILIFPVTFEYLKENTFYIYALMCAGEFLFVLIRKRVPKGKTFGGDGIGRVHALNNSTTK